MKSFSSSAINKSGKKFAPKAPVRRTAPTAPAPPRAPSRRASVASQTSASHPPPTASETATLQPSASTSTFEEPPPAFEPPVTAPSVAAPTVEHAFNQPATAIPVPQPKRKPSFAVPVPQSTKDVSQTSVPSTPVTARLVAQVSDHQLEAGDNAETNLDTVAIEETPVPLAVPVLEDEVAADTRLTKRPRTTVEAVPVTGLDSVLDEAFQLATLPNTQTPALRERTASHDETEMTSTDQRSGSTAKTSKRRASRSTSNDTGKVKKERKRRTRKREPTPEGAEQIEIRPSVVKMSDLCKDMRTGKRSKRETELRAHELAEAERKRALHEEGQEDETVVKQIPTDATPDGGENGDKANKTPQAGPVMRIVNGEIVLDAASLQVDRHADAEKNGDDLEDVVENSLTRKINQSTYGKRSKTESWDEEMTDLFYRGLRMFGTDFMVISKMFPGRSRRQIKLKFNNEERRDPQRIKETLLGPRESIDINTYSEMTNTVYDDPRIIQQELDEEKRLIKEQHEKDKKAQEDQLRNPDGLAGNGASGPDKAVVKGKRNNKKTARDIGGGTEEILGSIDD
ncbi:hypothetical protein BJY04DRAFT_125927 [Aspergillus karnatakaensis]|uniref:transcription factor TFIIIB subunit BDP1 n=1 Tax=Aspergillus karnatakaensis TaxID=1810916 RepID=UPI003CCCD3FF